MGRGGSRYGAGRPASHIKAEHCRQIDVRRWHREGILQAGRAGGWYWTDAETGEHRASIGYCTSETTVTLLYSIDDKPSGQTVLLERTSCTYGGTRPWFVCPIRGERVAVLYLRGGRFACRQCQRLSYLSQSGDAIDRSWRRQQKVEARLAEHWSRPKGMHRSTHQRLVSAIMRCEEQREAALAQYLLSLSRRDPFVFDGLLD